MVKVLNTIVTEFWPFVAACVLIGVFFDGVATVVRAWRCSGGG